MLLVRLLLALLDPPHREPGGAVPALFALASFDPLRQDLHPWMTNQLIQDYPALDARAPGGGIAPGRRDHTPARALVEHRLALPLLDGPDQVPEALRHHVLNSINEVFNAKAPLVLTSRSAEYPQAPVQQTHWAAFGPYRPTVESHPNTGTARDLANMPIRAPSTRLRDGHPLLRVAVTEARPQPFIWPASV
ncbi:hypothetical protein J7F01_23730 [Streptomyces sp. ISL-22]|uniref:hypothetical protein n=1 Tax=unclassified Streptomyces TaxID=2593676 RepID=UPI001BEC72BD|nr:hypothetical protein [Streptomyces sp. ISL-24]MBT2435125.1 hypothetical protein [Streptomyces sp. ISL-22]